MKVRIGVVGVGGGCAHYHLPHLLARGDVDQVTVYGSEKSYRIEKERLYDLDRINGWSEVRDLPFCGNSTDYFVDAVLGKVKNSESITALDGLDGLKAHRVIDAIKDAGRTGCYVEVVEG